ncbi:DMT family transporter [Erysipelothrix aquatica]|uniref:DMT family transporter n=1 Tax=Erysipelothrix aquatica TaxID=2683714 RepID=UPI0039EFF91F
MLPILVPTLSSVVARVGKIVMAMILDHFALIGMEQKPIQIQKVVAVLAIVLGIVLLKLQKSRF